MRLKKKKKKKADHEQDWQPYPVDPHSAICDDHTYIHTCVPFVAFDQRFLGDQCEWHRMTRMTGPDCAVMRNLINIHTSTSTSTSRKTSI